MMDGQANVLNKRSYEVLSSKQKKNFENRKFSTGIMKQLWTEIT